MMKDISSLPPLADVIRIHELATKKSLGQHFLLNGAITDRIAQYAGDLSTYNVIEIGPGPGGLTRSLLKAGAKTLHVIEKDERCLEIMSEIQKIVGERLQIIHGDAMEVDLIEAVPAPRKIVANLPYNVGTELLIQWLNSVHTHGKKAFESMTLMFQKEVAERIIAQPGSKDYGRLSVFSQWLTDARKDMELPPGAFSPPPKVSSTVVTLTPRDKPLFDIDKKSLEQTLAAAFGQRRKMLRQSLKSLGVDTLKLLEMGNIDGTRRAETLSVAEFCRLAQKYVEIRAKKEF